MVPVYLPEFESVGAHLLSPLVVWLVGIDHVATSLLGSLLLDPCNVFEQLVTFPNFSPRKILLAFIIIDRF